MFSRARAVRVDTRTALAQSVLIGSCDRALRHDLRGVEFVATVNDPAFRAEAKERRMIVNPVSAEKIQEVINRAMATPEPLLAKFRQMVKIGPPKERKKK